MATFKFPSLAIFVISLLVLLQFAGTVHSVDQSSTTTPTATFVPARDLDLLPEFSQLMTTRDQSCSLPCWWGLQPGKTTKEQVSAFLRATGFDRTYRLSEGSGTISLAQWLDGGQGLSLSFHANAYYPANLLMSFGFEQDTLSLISLNFLRPGDWLPEDQNQVSLPQILNAIDETPQIYSSTDPFRNDMIVVYQNLNIRIYYDFAGWLRGNATSPAFNMCLGLENARSISLALLAHAPTTSPSSSGRFVPFEDAFNVSLDTFVQFFRENPNGCLVVTRKSSSSQ